MSEEMSEAPFRERAAKAARHAYYRAMVALSSVVERAAFPRRLVLLSLGIVSVLVGFWGWVIWGDEQGQLTLGFWSKVHATMGLFTISGPVENVNWQLSVARIIAPLAVAGSIVEFALVSVAKGMRARTAATAIGHLVVLGPARRAAPYLKADPAAERLESPAVHVEHSDAAGLRNTIKVDDDRTDDGWIGASGAMRAGKVVIATGDDARNLACLRAAIDHSVPGTDGSILVEVDDADLALRLSVRLAVDHPDTHVEAVCPDAARAAFAGAHIKEALRARYGEEHEERPELTIVGDSQLAGLLVNAGAAALRAVADDSGRFKPHLTIVDTSAGQQLKPLLSSVAEHGCDSSYLTDPDALHDAALGPLSAVVDFVDSARTARTGFDLTCVRPGSMVWLPQAVEVLGNAREAPDERDDEPRPTRWKDHQPRVLPPGQMVDEGYLTGPFTRAAQLCGRASVSSATVRRVVGALAAAGWPVVPRADLSGLPGRSRARHLEPDLRDTLVQGGVSDLGPEGNDLVRALEDAGLVVAMPEP